MLIEIDATGLVRQAGMTAQSYFEYAHRILRDSELKFTAADVIALAAICAQDFHTAFLGKIADEVNVQLNELSTSIKGESYE